VRPLIGIPTAYKKNWKPRRWSRKIEQCEDSVHVWPHGPKWQRSGFAKRGARVPERGAGTKRFHPPQVSVINDLVRSRACGHQEPLNVRGNPIPPIRQG
jgi:hypothetical protein